VPWRSRPRLQQLHAAAADLAPGRNTLFVSLDTDGDGRAENVTSSTFRWDPLRAAACKRKTTPVVGETHSDPIYMAGFGNDRQVHRRARRHLGARLRGAERVEEDRGRDARRDRLLQQRGAHDPPGSADRGPRPRRWVATLTGDTRPEVQREARAALNEVRRTTAR
jgi:hypothetical protein